MSGYHINKAVRHYDHDHIMLLLNHFKGVKGGVGQERWIDSTQRIIKNGRMRAKSKKFVI